MKSIEVTGKTTQDAIDAGLEQLGVSFSDVKVEYLEEGSKGLFGLFGSRPAKVRLTVLEDEEASDEVHQLFVEALSDQPEQKPAKAPARKAPEKKPAAAEPAAPAEPAEAPKKPAKPAKAAQPKPAKPREEKKEEPKKEAAPVVVTPAVKLDPNTMAGKAQEFLTQVTELMGVKSEVHITTDEEGFLRADLQGDTSGLLIGRRGETLDALQYLTSLHINKGQSDYTRITLDTENYRARREDTLIRLANRYANRAVKTGRRVSVEPMNPYERRIMHSALQENELVDTHSEGEEPNRHIVITPRKQPTPSKAE